MTRRDIFEEARRRSPLPKTPKPRPAPPDPPAPARPPAGVRDPSIAASRYQVGTADAAAAGTYMDGMLRKGLKVGQQLHEKKGYYYRKWREAMQRTFAGRRRRGG